MRSTMGWHQVGKYATERMQGDESAAAVRGADRYSSYSQLDEPREGDRDGHAEKALVHHGLRTKLGMGCCSSDSRHGREHWEQPAQLVLNIWQTASSGGARLLLRGRYLAWSGLIAGSRSAVAQSIG